MTQAAYPYATYLDVKFEPLKLIDISSLAKAVTDQWYNQTLCRVNDSVVRLGVMEGEYHRHKHDNDEEFFFVSSVEGSSSTLKVDLLSFCPIRDSSCRKASCIAPARRRRA
jgi:hypothetical protein